MQSLCTLRSHCRQGPRNTRYQADATPYLGRTCTGWIAPACGWRTYSITSSARASSAGGTVSPSARLDVVGGSDPQLEIRTSDTAGDDAGVILQGARNASTEIDSAYVDFRNFDSDEGAAGTEYSTAMIGAGMQNTSGQAGYTYGLRARHRIWLPLRPTRLSLELE